MSLFYPLNSLAKDRCVLLHLNFPSRLKHSSAGSYPAVMNPQVGKMPTSPAWALLGQHGHLQVCNLRMSQGKVGGGEHSLGEQVSLCSWYAKSQLCQDLSLLYPIHKHPKCQVPGLLSWSGTSLLDAAVQALVWCKRVPVLQQSHRFRSDASLDWFYWRALESEAVAAKSA